MISPDNQTIEKFFNAIPSQRCLVIGDAMIDEYIWGTADRISPEAPVPVVKFGKREQRLGGAGNVALNLRTLGAEVLLCSIIGNDGGGEILAKLLSESTISSEGLFQSTERPTTVKTRVLAGSQHLLRIDNEKDFEPGETEKQQFTQHCLSVIKSFNPTVVIFEDYDKGSIYKELITEVVKQCNAADIPVAVDPKYRNFFAYSGVSLFKPNFKELTEATGFLGKEKSESAVKSCLAQLTENLNAKLYLITLSEKGVYFQTQTQSGVLPAHFRKIADVSGAGDTVIAVASLALAAQMDASFIAFISNLAGGMVCEEAGVVPIFPEKLKEEAMKD